MRLYIYIYIYIIQINFSLQRANYILNSVFVNIFSYNNIHYFITLTGNIFTLININTTLANYLDIVYFDPSLMKQV